MSIEVVKAVLGNLNVQSVFELLSLPWYVTALLVLAGLFVTPWFLSLFAKGVTVLIVRCAVQEKTGALSSELIERNRALAQRTQQLHQKQYHSNGLNLGTAPSIIASAVFILIPVVYFLLCFGSTRQMPTNCVTTASMRRTVT